MFTTEPSPSSVLALVTTLHLGLAALRNHRRLTSWPVGSLAIVSLFLAGLPWVFPSPAGLGLGLLAHGAWFWVCERLVPAPGSPRGTAVSAAASHAPTLAASKPSGRAGGALREFIPVPVLAVVEETPTIKTIRLARPEQLELEAGQFITVRLRIDGKDYARCYSVSSAPDTRGYLEISVRRQGTVSNALHASLRPGSLLFIKGPLGAFTYPSGDDRPLVMFAGGIGITPLMSMLRHAVAAAPARPVTLLYSARDVDDFAFHDELQTIARRHPQVSIHLAVSSGAPGPRLYPGRIDEALVRATVPNLTDSICLICGPAPMIDGMRALLASLQVPASQIRYEVFNAAVAASAGHEAAHGHPHPVRPHASHAPDARAGSAHYQVQCQETGRSIPVGEGQTLLEAAEAGNVPILSLCRAGACGTCRVKVTAGTVVCDSDVLGPEDQAQGYVLACVTTVESDCVVLA